MGSRYIEAVVSCLEGRFIAHGDNVSNAELKLAYFDKVVQNLGSCRA